jgi:hypothetical protein
MIRSLGILGTGRFVAFLEPLIRNFFPMIEIKTTMPEAAACDVVVLAGPLEGFEAVVTELGSLMHKDAVIIDAEPAKSYTTDILKRIAKDRPYISMQPMFGPLSYEKNPDIEGRKLIIAEQTLSSVLYMLVVAALKQGGIKIEAMTPESTDEYVARSLFCTHFPEKAEEGGLLVAEHDTLYFGDLTDPAEAYKLNPFCEIMRNKLGIAEGDVQALLKV